MPPKFKKSNSGYKGKARSLSKASSDNDSYRGRSKTRYPLRNQHQNDEDNENINHHIGDVNIDTMPTGFKTDDDSKTGNDQQNISHSSSASNHGDNSVQSSLANNSSGGSVINSPTQLFTNRNDSPYSGSPIGNQKLLSATKKGKSKAKIQRQQNEEKENEDEIQVRGGKNENLDVNSVISNQSARMDKIEKSLETLTQLILEKHHSDHSENNTNQRSTDQNPLNGTSMPAPPHQPAPSRHNNTRQTLDLPLLEMTYQGRELINSPVLLQDGDEAYWRYSGDYIRHVRILETTMPTLLRRNPIYHFQCENGQEYDDRHDKLFISKEEALEIDPTGVIRSSRSPTTALEDLDLTAIDSNLPNHIKRQWEQLDPEKFKLATLSTSIKDYKLSNDSIVAIKRLMDFLSQSVTGASKTGLLKLPSIRDLTPATTIRDLWLPPPSHPRFDKANACYLNIASSFALLFETEDFAAKAPKAQLAIASVIGGTADGIDVLDHLLKSRIPALGATDFSPYASIASLQVEDGMLLIKFLAAAQDIQAQLTLSSHAAEDNTLFKQFLTELMKTNVHSFIGNTFGDFNRFSKMHGNIRKYSRETIDSVARYLIDGKAPEILRLNDKVNDTSTRDVNDLSPFKQAYIKHKSRSNFSRPKFASMAIKSNQSDDATVDNDFKFTETEIKQAEEQIAPMFESMKSEYSGDLEVLYDDLVYNAMAQIKASRKPCEICSQPHPDECWLRGPDFQPEWLRKRIQQINLRDGDKPSVPPAEKVTPPKSTYSKKSLRFNAMSFPSTDANNMLDRITSELESDLANETLPIAPKMASIRVSNDVNSDDSNATSIRGPADNLSVNDYSVFDSQDFC